MKILRIFGVVVGVHVFALMLIFVNPGCSSTNKPPPPAADAPADQSETAAAPSAVEADSVSPLSVASAPVDTGASPVVRFSPTRPGTPAATALETAPVSDVVPATTYAVVSGDSLWTIARKHHLTVAELAAANNIKSSSVVRIGQKLIIPAKAVSGSSVSMTEPAAAKAVATPAAPRANGETVKHVVRPGETLGAIARKYQVRVGEIAAANAIADPAKIRPGMELTIPGFKTPAVRAAATPSPASTDVPATSPATPPVTEVPTLVIPSAEGEGSAAPGGAEPPVIPVEETP